MDLVSEGKADGVVQPELQTKTRERGSEQHRRGPGSWRRRGVWRGGDRSDGHLCSVPQYS